MISAIKLDKGRPHVIGVGVSKNTGKKCIYYVEAVEGVEDLQKQLSILKSESEVQTMLGEIIADMHNRGVIHRDLWPENAVMWGSPGNRQIQVIDFGDSFSYDNVLEAPIHHMETEAKKFIDRSLQMRYPRIDRGVTIDTRHLLRMVGTVHSGTGRVCTRIEDIADFSPDMAPTVWDLLQ